jgi:hypothetical protein
MVEDLFSSGSRAGRSCAVPTPPAVNLDGSFVEKQEVINVVTVFEPYMSLIDPTKDGITFGGDLSQDLARLAKALEAAIEGRQSYILAQFKEYAWLELIKIYSRLKIDTIGNEVEVRL